MHVNTRSNQGKHTATIFKEQENEKKRKYNQRVMDVEMGTFTPPVFGTNGGMGLDCQNFLRTLANKFSTINDEPYASVISSFRIQLSLAILRTVHRCFRGSRYPFKSREVLEDFTLAVAGLQLYSIFRLRFFDSAFSLGMFHTAFICLIKNCTQMHQRF